MPEQMSKAPKGGRCLSTSDARKQFYSHYRAIHGGTGNKFTGSKEHRGCGPLARYNRRKQIEEAALENGRHNGHPTLGELPFTDKTCRMLAFARLVKG